MTQNKPTDKAPGQASRRQQRLALRFRAAHITGPGIDAIGLVNDLWLAEDKEATRRKNGENLPTGARRLLVQQQRQQASRRSRNPVQYQHGVTRPGTPPELLRAEVELKGYAHSRVLNRNMKAAGVTRPTSVPAQCVHAHHTVAHGEWNARFSRDLLIGWGIGINDVDNGVHLPANKNTFVPELPNATKHMSVHTQRYHLMVFDRLNQANASDPLDGRAVLREIGGELLNDTFPYRPGESS